MAYDMPAPCNAASWWDEKSLDVGTGKEANSYLFTRRVHLQLEIESSALCDRCGYGDKHEPPPKKYGRKCDNCGAALTSADALDTIADVRCWLENEDLGLGPNRTISEEDLALLVVERLKGKTLAEAAATSFKDTPGQPTLIEEAVRAALRDWAEKFHERALRLPQFPPEPSPYRPSLLRRILYLVPFLRGLGV